MHRVSRLGATRTSLAILLALLAPPLVPLEAQTPAPGQSLAQQRAALARANAQAEAARKRAQALASRAASASEAADKARDQAAILAARVQQSEADLRAGEARLAVIATQQRAQARRLAVRQRPIVRLTAALQQLARRSPILALVEPGSVDDAVHRRIVLSQVMPVVMERTKDLRTDLARSAALRRSEEAELAGIRKGRADLDARRAQLASAEQRLRVAARQYRETAGIETERALAMGEAARDIGDLLGRVEAAGSVRESLLRLPGPTLRPAAPGQVAAPAVQPASGDPAARPPAYRLPVVGNVVTGFGELDASGLRSQGLAIAVSPAATVVAPASGRVAFAGPFRGYGQILIIEHGGGWTSLIANLGRLSAAVGDELRAGDPVGSAPDAARPRIALELRQGEQPVNIAGLLR